MIECGYMENGECNTCAECMSCPENNLKEDYICEYDCKGDCQQCNNKFDCIHTEWEG